MKWCVIVNPLRTELHSAAIHVASVHSTAKPIARFQHDHVEAASSESPGTGESCEPGTNDDDVDALRSTLDLCSHPQALQCRAQSSHES